MRHKLDGINPGETETNSCSTGQTGLKKMIRVIDFPVKAWSNDHLFSGKSITISTGRPKSPSTTISLNP